LSLVEEYGLDSPSRAMLLLALSIKDSTGARKMRILHLQKTIRFFEYLRQSNQIEFSNYHLGAVSSELQENVESLEEYGFVEETENQLSLSETGDQAVSELKSRFAKDELQKMAFAKRQLNDLTSDELMFFMYMLLPDTRVNSTEWARLQKKTKQITTGLFKKGRVNSQMAAKWLGMTEKDFLRSLAD
jgi:uncharacterized protein YwgA